MKEIYYLTEGSILKKLIVGGFVFIQFLTNGFSAINKGLGRSRTNLKILAVGFYSI